MGVVPYQVTRPWADHAGKARFIVLPVGETITPNGDEDWDFPEGTILIKNFFYSTDRRAPEETVAPIETRLMIKGVNDWKGHTYVWNEELTEATRKASGTRKQLNFIDADGMQMSQEYIVPNTNQCKDCHERHEHSRPLGLVQRQLSRPVFRDGEDQDHRSRISERPRAIQSEVDGASRGPSSRPFYAAPLETRARSYLDANCAHCHRDGGNGGPSGLVLLAAETNPTAYGVCKGPVAAGEGTGGFYHDILPGKTEQSIMIHRMKSTDPEVKMPGNLNRLPHEAGIELVSEWIRQMPETPCD